MKTALTMYLCSSLFFAVAGVLDFNKKDTKKFSLKWTIWVFFYCFICWPYGGYIAAKNFLKNK